MSPRLASLAPLLFLAAACAETPPGPAPPPPAIETDPETGISRMTLSVLIYNVAGLPWPVGRDRAAALDRIADELRALAEAGEAPDLLLLQEAFTGRARRIGERAGYPHRLSGPRAGDAPTIDAPRPDAAFLAGRRMLKGEGIGKLLSSGLEIYSRHPILGAEMTAFGRDSCAGFDCLASKGVMLAYVKPEGAPAPVQILNTHLNSRLAAGVPVERSLAAHNRQIDEIGLFLETALNPDWPLIFGGDFNTRNAANRYEHAFERMPGTVVAYHCTQLVESCDVRLSWDGDAPWLDTQDRQGFLDGARIRVRPLRVEAMFDAPREGRMLSDHDGYLVTYELSWDEARP